MDVERTDVLIVGGAVVGLSTALFLAQQGISVLLVERHPSTLLHPRARVINSRAVEIYRQAGVADELFAARSLTSDMAAKYMLQAETLNGAARVLTPLADEVPEITEDITPCGFCTIDQNHLEDIVRRRAAEAGADIRYSTELIRFDQDDDGVDAVVAGRGGGPERHVRARYMVAADGHQGATRERLGIARSGMGTLAHVLSLVFAADLTGPLRGRDVGLAYLDRPEPGTLLMPLDNSRWVFFTPYHPEAGETVAGFGEAQCVDRIRTAVGVPDLRVELEAQLPEAGTKLLGFELAAEVSDRFADRRVFLVGDSAHAIPPTGAFGASTGIQDAHNLAWKLAAVIKGSAGPGLLASYDAERRPVARFTMDQAAAELARRSGFGGGDDEGPAYAATVFGHRYRSGAVLSEPGGTAEPDLAHLGSPGARAPHVELSRNGRVFSILDLFGGGFVLLTGTDADTWGKAGYDVARRFGAEMSVHSIGEGGDCADRSGRFPAAYGVAADGAVLVRPDGVVAWRSTAADAQADRVTVLERVLGRVLARS